MKNSKQVPSKLGSKRSSLDNNDLHKKQLLKQYIQMHQQGTLSIDNFGTISGSSSIVQPHTTPYMNPAPTRSKPAVIKTQIAPVYHARSQCVSKQSSPLGRPYAQQQQMVQNYQPQQKRQIIYSGKSTIQQNQKSNSYFANKIKEHQTAQNFNKVQSHKVLQSLNTSQQSSARDYVIPVEKKTKNHVKINSMNIVLSSTKRQQLSNKPTASHSQQSSQINLTQFHKRHTSSQQEQNYRKSMSELNKIIQPTTTVKINHQFRGREEPTKQYQGYTHKSRSSVASPTASLNSNKQKVKLPTQSVKSTLQNKSLSHVQVLVDPQQLQLQKRQIKVKTASQGQQTPFQQSQIWTGSVPTPQSISPKQHLYQTPQVQSIKITKQKSIKQMNNQRAQIVKQQQEVPPQVSSARMQAGNQRFNSQQQQLILLHQRPKQPTVVIHGRSQSQLVDNNQEIKQTDGYRTITTPMMLEKHQESRPISQKKHQLFSEFELFQNNLDHVEDSPHEQLMTEEDEQVFRQVASDINENAFFGKQMKRIHSAVTNPSTTNQLSPRSKEIANVMRIIKEQFKRFREPPITELDFYRVGKKLGRGAFGKVNLAMHKLVRKLVALKSLNKEILNDQDQKVKLLKEVNLLLKMRHSHVVKIYETIETEKHIVIVMELCAGGDLLNYVRKRRKLKEPIALKIFKQIIDGLCYTHGKNIAHRDIKLDNVLLDGVGNVKIGDFGVSKQIQPNAMMFEQCGTPAYIAPEILRNKGYSLNVDLWSAGVVLFAMLYGSVPFKGQSMEELHDMILNGRYTLKEDISKDAIDLLRGLLEINPQKRITIQQIYLHPWMQNYDDSIKLFTQDECELINKEYTYNHPSRYQRNEGEPLDGFTEQHIESEFSEIKNNTTKSIILAPFNSTMTDKTLDSLHFDEELFISKGLQFSRRCREANRQYEFNNNGQLDNGVYHKQLVQNSFEREQAELKNESTQGIMIEQKLTSSKPGYNPSLQLESDEQMTVIYETFQKHNLNNIDKHKVEKLTQFGYPREYVESAVKNMEPNYCTAGYYLIDMVQNYC